MDWKIASILLLTISVVSAGFIMQESLKMRNCEVEANFNAEKKILKLRITNPTQFPMKIDEIEIYKDVNVMNSEILSSVKAEIIVQPDSYTDIYIPLKGDVMQLRGVIYATGLFGNSEIPFFLCRKSGSVWLEGKCSI